MVSQPGILVPRIGHDVMPVWNIVFWTWAGFGVEMKTPYWQIDVQIEGVDTIFKGYLGHGKAEIGMRVKARFRTGNPSHTILDICWVPVD